MKDFRSGERPDVGADHPVRAVLQNANPVVAVRMARKVHGVRHSLSGEQMHHIPA